MKQVDGMIFIDLPVIFQHLDGMPPHIVHLSVLLPQRTFHLVDKTFQPRLIVNHNPLRTLLIVMNYRMHQHVQPAALSG